MGARVCGLLSSRGGAGASPGPAGTPGVPPPRPLTFGFCGLDHSVPDEVLREVFVNIQETAERVRFFAAFQLAYQGYPDKPTPPYMPDGNVEERRYGGLVYPPWEVIRSFRKNFPQTPVSFHLNETPQCPYVGRLLRGEKEEYGLIDQLVKEFNATMIQINLTADGVPLDLFMPERGATEEALHKLAKTLCDLFEKYPGTIFLLPLANFTKRDGSLVDTRALVDTIMRRGTPPNMALIYDSSAGTGLAPDKVPEIPAEYPGKGQPLAFTGGIGPDNATEWLERYSAATEAHGCSLICDAQSSIRKEQKRTLGVEPEALTRLARNVAGWAKAAQEEEKP